MSTPKKNSEKTTLWSSPHVPTMLVKNYSLKCLINFARLNTRGRKDAVSATLCKF
jgi:hypothetical protein